MRPTLSRSVLALLPAMAFVWVAAPGCAKKKPTALMVALSSEAATPKEIDAFEIEVRRGDSTPFFRTYSVDPSQTGAEKLPGTIALSNGEGEDASQAVTIVIRAKLQGSEKVLRQATLGFSEEKTKLLKMPLRYSCLDFPSETCLPGESCKGGECKPDAIDVQTLPDYSDDQVFGVQGSSACFDDRQAGMAACLQSIQDVDVTALAATPAGADCTVHLGSGVITMPDGGTGGGDDAGTNMGADGGASVMPPDAGAGALSGPADPGNLNVAVHWKAATDPQRLTVLDLDPQEGWSFTGQKDGFTLGRGLCEAVRNKAVTRIVYSTECAPKLLTQPICTVPSQGGGSGGGSGIGGSGGAAGTDFLAACESVFNAYCDKLACDKRLSSSADCQQSGASACAAVAALPGVVAANVAACAPALQATTCDAFLTQTTLCDGLAGSLADGTSCFADAQCSSGACVGVLTATSCGQCGPRLPLGAACLDRGITNPCQKGAVCDGHNCVPKATVGQACMNNGSHCPASLLTCENGACAIPHAKAGDLCTSDSTCNSVDANLRCNGSNCVPYVTVQPGQPCDTSIDACVSSVCKTDATGSMGVCTAKSQLGGPCVTGNDCVAADCDKTGKCILAIPSCSGSGGGGMSGGTAGMSGGGGKTGTGGSPPAGGSGGAPVMGACASNGAACLAGPCMQQAKICAGDPTCGACVANPTGPGCMQNVNFKAVDACACVNAAAMPACGSCCVF